MGKIIYRTEKIKTAGEVSGREAEANRTSEDKGRFQNSDINWELTDSNYDFKITHNWIDAVKDLCKELGCPVKKDSVLVLDHLITASPEWMKAQTEETRMQFFEDAKQWIVDEFCGGDERLLLNCRIHKDEESNWHMCAATAPIMKNPQRSEEELAQLKRKSRQKEYSLNAKAIMGGREKYGSRQQSIEDKVGKKYGLEEREVREQGQAKKHRTVQQAKLDSLRTQVRELGECKDVLLEASETIKRVTSTLTADKSTQVREHLPAVTKGIGPFKTEVAPSGVRIDNDVWERTLEASRNKVVGKALESSYNKLLKAMKEVSALADGAEKDNQIERLQIELRNFEREYKKKLQAMQRRADIACQMLEERGELGFEIENEINLRERFDDAMQACQNGEKFINDTIIEAYNAGDADLMKKLVEAKRELPEGTYSIDSELNNNQTVQELLKSVHNNYDTHILHNAIDKIVFNNNLSVKEAVSAIAKLIKNNSDDTRDNKIRDIGHSHDDQDGPELGD